MNYQRILDDIDIFAVVKAVKSGRFGIIGLEVADPCQAD